MSLPEAYFRGRWTGDDDPWRIADRFYERRKRDLVLATLPRERFGRAFEAGCAAGHLTERLAGRCDELWACDGAERAVALAAQRVSGLGHVRVSHRWLPDQWPSGRFDLVVLSEVAYYLDAPDLVRLADLARDSLTDEGVLVLCHWRHPAPGYPSTAEQVHERLAGLGLRPVARHAEVDLLLDVWTRGEASVARAEGWLP